ncbi:MAG TPA: Na+/H+ antiporter NhaC family protein [Longimicrobiales bacterium]|nr:Na+/H+ antiporter NhaC family protein [Longimicrobiales bacterium]
MSDPTWVSVLPPVVAIVLAIWTRQVYLSLFGGLVLGYMILAGWNPVTGLGGAIQGTVDVFKDGGNTSVIMFTLVIGALIATIESSGGVRGFVAWLDRTNKVSTSRGAQFLVYIAAPAVFIESNINVLVRGAVGRPLCDRYKCSREKLAFILDSTSAPMCVLLPMNAWGAYVLSILAGLGVEAPLTVFLEGVVLDFYAIIMILLVGFVILRGWDIGPMKAAEERTRGGLLLWPNATPLIDQEMLSPQITDKIPPRAWNMVAPLAVMVLFMPLGLWVTGDGKIMSGSGTTSVLWAVMAGLAAAWLMLLAQKAYTVDELTKIALKGAGGLVPLALIMLLAIALGAMTRELGTGVYVASVTAGVLPPFLFLPLIFIVASVIAFATGTSWGTFAIMLPIAVPAAIAMDLPLAPFVAAVLSGGVFGDHCSPISDTTILASMAAATDHIDHVRTQLPYALIAAGISTVLFAVTGAFL